MSHDYPTEAGHGGFASPNAYRDNAEAIYKAARQDDSPIEQEFKQLAALLGEAHTAMSVLESRLSLVLRPANDEKTSMGAASDSDGSPMLLKMRNTCYSVRTLVARLEVLRARVQV